MNDIALSTKRSKTRIFNPHRLKANELQESFIARQELFHSILDDLASGKSKSPPQHQLVIGQRGMGKTTLLLRLALELHREPHCQHLLPLNFPEEQYIEVDRLSKFWLNCLDATADALEYEGKMEVVTQIDVEVQRLSQMQTDETTYHESCREAFTAVWKRLGRRPVLFIDNFNLLLSRLRKEDFSLRGYFSAPGAPVLVAASTVYPDEMADYGAAFYDGFKPHYLHPLTLDEVKDVLIRLAQTVGQPGLVDRIYRELPRLAALRDLTGGNPRTAVLLFELFADGFSEDAFEDLDALLDLVTPLYQSRLEQLSDLAQTIVGTLARNWSPMSKADIVSQARLVDSSVPAQLGRLREIGLVEETPLFPSKKTGYQIAERFFNIWYLMRFASRRQRASLACLTRFLEEFHTPAERTRSARELLKRDGLTRGNITYAMALAGSLQGEPALARDLEWKAQLELIEQMQGVRARIADILDPDEIPHAVYSFAELKQRLEQAVPADSQISGPAFARLVLGSPSLVPGGIDKPRSGDRNSIAAAKLTSKSVDDLVNEFEMEAETIGQQFSTKCFEWLQSRLNAGTLTNWSDPAGLSSMIQWAEDETSMQLVRKFGHPKAKSKLPADSVEKLCSVLNLRPSAKSNAFDWLKFGYELHVEFSRYPDAEKAFREAIRLDPNHTIAWTRLGNLLRDLDRDQEAAKAYREAICIDPNYFYAWTRLGDLLVDLVRYQEAEQAYREAIRLDPNDGFGWLCLGDLLEHHLKRFTEAEQAYREANRVDPNYQFAWTCLGNLLKDHPARYLEAEQAYREAIRIDPNDAYAWTKLGNLMGHILGRYPEAEQAYLEAIRVDPNYASAWTWLGNLLRDHLARHIEAEQAYREAIRIDPNYAYAWTEFGNLLGNILVRYPEAEQAYREAIRINPNNDYAWSCLGKLRQYYLCKPDEAVVAFRQALEINPNHDSMRHNLAFLLRDHRHELIEAKSILQELRQIEEWQDTQALHEALFAAYEDDWPRTAKSLKAALALIDGRLPSNTRDDWFRASAVLLHLGFGERLVGLLTECGADVTLMPWFAAVQAHALGDKRHLVNIPLEARPAAEQIFDQIDHRRQQLPPPRN